MQFILARPVEAAVTIVVVAFLFLSHLPNGANSTGAGLTLAALQGGMFLAVMARPWARAAFQRAHPLTLPAAAFAVTIAVALWSLTPWVPGGPHPVWSYVTGPGAATLDRTATLFEIFKLLGAACVFGLGWLIGRSDDRARLAVHALIIGGCVYALWSLVLFAANRQPGAERMGGTFLSINTAGALFATLLVMGCAAAVAAARPRSSRKTDAAWIQAAPQWAAAALFGACLLLTGSRGGAVAAGLGLVAFFALEAFAGRVHRGPMLAAGAMAGILLLVQGSVLLSRLGQTPDLGSGGRGEMFKLYWQAVQDSPLFGYGLGTFDALNKLRLDAATYESLWSTRAAHNVYLQWLLEAGLIGALPMFATIALILSGTWLGLQRRMRSTTPVRGLMAASVVLMAQGWADFALQVPSMVGFWAFLLGLQLSLANGSSTSKA